MVILMSEKRLDPTVFPNPEDLEIKKEVEIDASINVTIETSNPLIKKIVVYGPVPVPEDYKKWNTIIKKLERTGLIALKRYSKKIYGAYRKIYEDMEKMSKSSGGDTIISMRKFLDVLSKKINAKLELNSFSSTCHYYISVKKKVNGVGEVDIIIRSDDFECYDGGGRVFLKWSP